MEKSGLRRILRLRWFVYAALILFFGSQALIKACRPEPAATGAADEDMLGPGGIKPTRYYTLPDGQKAPVYEVTPEEAERHFGVKQKPAQESPPSQPDANVDTKGDAGSSSGAETSSGKSATTGSAP